MDACRHHQCDASRAPISPTVLVPRTVSSDPRGVAQPMRAIPQALFTARLGMAPVRLVLTPASTPKRSFAWRSTLLFLRIFSDDSQLHPADQLGPLGFGCLHLCQDLL
jgi:hypothetical protein